MSRIRLTLDISTKVDDELTRLSGKMDTTKAGGMRRALSLLFATDAAKEEGLEVGAWKEEGGVRTERVFLLPS
mgnify:CR=1 FL=1